MDKKRNLIIIISAVLIVVFMILFISPKEVKQIQSNNKVKITQNAAKQIKLVNYETDNFTMQIPQGWKVETAGTEMFYAIKIYDTKDERNQIFAVLKAQPFLKSNAAKKWHQWYVDTTGNQTYKMFSEAIVLNPPTVENFYSSFNNYTEYAKKYEATYSNYDFPSIGSFKKIEQFESNTYMKNVSKDDKTIRATFEDKNKKAGEGLFMASVVDYGSVYAGSIDASFYGIYNIIFITSAKDEFIDYKDVLTKSLKTLEYKSSFINATNKAITERTNAALKANATIQSAYDSYNKAWSQRQTTYDITSQKYSDATLGYERVYDTETGEIYKAYNGFTDDYDGKRYQAITDDMYTESISGYIEK